MSFLSWWIPYDLKVSLGSIGSFMFMNKGCFVYSEVNIVVSGVSGFAHICYSICIVVWFLSIFVQGLRRLFLSVENS